MRHHQDTGGPSAVYPQHIFGHAPLNPAAEALFAAAIDDFERAMSADAGARVTRRIGKLLAHRPRPRRLDARIVTRRPMMLVKPRPWSASPIGRIAGREIIARR